MYDTLTELRGIVSRHTPGRYQPSVLPRVALYKDGAAPQPVSGVYQPMMASTSQTSSISQSASTSTVAGSHPCSARRTYPPLQPKPLLQ
jgi:hypothetical protein